MTVTRRDFLKASATTVIGAAGLGLGQGGCQSGVTARPNILVILSDQQHWQAMGQVDPFFDTPHLDAFAKHSIVFEKAFVSTAQCAPSRSTLWTGLMPSKTGVFGNEGALGPVEFSSEHLGHFLQRAGYTTHYFGKWHLSKATEVMDGWTEHRYKTTDPRISERAEALFSNRRSNDPFCAILSYRDPHGIYDVDHENFKLSVHDVPLPVSYYERNLRSKPAAQLEFMRIDQGKKYFEKGDLKFQEYRAAYRHMVSRYDAQVGRVLTALEASGQADNTLVVIASDHGDMDTQQGLVFKGPFAYEHAIRVPLMIRMPTQLRSRPPGRETHAMASLLDLTPTLLDIARAPARETDGMSLLPWLEQSNRDSGREYVVTQYYGKQNWIQPHRMIRTSRHKFVCYRTGEEEVYDLLNDPHELTNLAGDPSAFRVKRALQGELSDWMLRNDDALDVLPLTDRKGSSLLPHPAA